MNAQRFPESNTVMRRPDGWTEDECCDVHAYRGEAADKHPVIITAWKPTPEELVRLNLGEPIYLCVWGQGMPPVALTLDNPFTAEACGEKDE